MKALEYLYRMKKANEENGNYEATNLYEAIAELESLQKQIKEMQSCGNCKHCFTDYCISNCDDTYKGYEFGFCDINRGSDENRI